MSTHDPAIDPVPTAHRLYVVPVEPPAAVHQRCQQGECPFPADWTCRNACPDEQHRPIALCDYHAEKKRQGVRTNIWYECQAHETTFPVAYLWGRL